MATVVYGNTDLPMCGLEPDPQLTFAFMPKDERIPWTKEYVILGRWEKGIYRSVWLRYELYERYKPEADKLVADYFKGGRFGKRTLEVCRYHKYICEAIADIITDNAEGFKVSVEYPEFDKPKGHVRLFHLER